MTISEGRTDFLSSAMPIVLSHQRLGSMKCALLQRNREFQQEKYATPKDDVLSAANTWAAASNG
jgi:hypothetical protein